MLVTWSPRSAPSRTSGDILPAARSPSICRQTASAVSDDDELKPTTSGLYGPRTFQGAAPCIFQSALQCTASVHSPDGNGCKTGCTQWSRPAAMTLPTPQPAPVAALPQVPPACGAGLANSQAASTSTRTVPLVLQQRRQDGRLWVRDQGVLHGLGHVHLCKVEGCCGERPESHEADGFAKSLVTEPARQTAGLAVNICRTDKSLCGHAVAHRLPSSVAQSRRAGSMSGMTLSASNGT